MRLPTINIPNLEVGYHLDDFAQDTYTYVKYFFINNQRWAISKKANQDVFTISSPDKLFKVSKDVVRFTPIDIVTKYITNTL